MLVASGSADSYIVLMNFSAGCCDKSLIKTLGILPGSRAGLNLGIVKTKKAPDAHHSAFRVVANQVLHQGCDPPSVRSEQRNSSLLCTDEASYRRLVRLSIFTKLTVAIRPDAHDPP